MDYLEEQTNELEALEAIYSNELTVVKRKPHPIFTIAIKSDPQKNDDEDNQSDTIYEIEVQFKLTDTYPDSLPVIEVTESDNLTDFDEQELLELLEREANDSLGMVMIYTLVSVAIDWINRKSDEKYNELKELLARKRREEEEAEHKKFDGTQVTVETFMVWKKQFDEEMQLLDKELKTKQELAKKLTGKQLFETNKSLFESDLQFLDDTDQDIDTDIKVDESLFQNMDDLEIDEDLE
ncbi:RWD domain-containing protein 1-like [Oppia nitens]|uniref:RWD domain-containing protein 1-like n=1 Tax=Oppia nitens TaxID=1686743 RepID=UPI0023DC6CE8|nr:RWD domain-containing protein 1-like [Oppia nitens]XP_054156407.1 RWD domain-containing protein 1-like [Oppia nitens]XP_054156408.1 RWD domain-containing protein 1-like [Oppia nitens]